MTYFMPRTRKTNVQYIVGQLFLMLSDEIRLMEIIKYYYKQICNYAIVKIVTWICCNQTRDLDLNRSNKRYVI